MAAEDTLGRRALLKQAGKVTAAAVVGESLTPAAACAGTADQLAGTIPVRTLGKTGLKLPILGYGGAALPKAWLNPLSREDRVALVRYAFDRGLRYFDTAGNYLESQAILGEALADRRRQACLVTKVETTRPEEVRRAVERSLKELRTDYVDVLLLHGTPGLEQMEVGQAMKIHAELAKLRGEKVTRFVGLSAHGYFDKALALIASGGFDLCMLSYGYIPRGHNQVWSARMTTLRDACLAKAHELDMGVVAMKVIGCGMLGAWAGYIVPGFDKQRLAHLPGAAIRHVLQDQRVQMLAVGMRLKNEIDANLRTVSGDVTYTLDDRALLAEFAAKLFDSEAIKKLRVE